MLLSTLLLIAANQFSNYTSYYELFAGLSSALAGIETLRSFIIDRLAKVFDKMRSQVSDTKDSCNSFVSQLIEVLHSTPGLQNSIDGQQHLLTLLQAQKWLTNAEKNVSTKEEDKKVNQIAIAVFSYVFCSCVYFLVFAGFQADKAISNNTTYACIANYELMSLISFGILALLVSWTNYCRERPVRVSCTTSIITLLISIAWPCQLTFKTQTTPIFVIIGSLVLCIFPIILLLFRGIVYLPYFKLKRIQSKLKAISANNTKVGDWLLNVTLPQVGTMASQNSKN